MMMMSTPFMILGVFYLLAIFAFIGECYKKSRLSAKSGNTDEDPSPEPSINTTQRTRFQEPTISITQRTQQTPAEITAALSTCYLWWGICINYGFGRKVYFTHFTRVVEIWHRILSLYISKKWLFRDIYQPLLKEPAEARRFRHHFLALTNFLNNIGYNLI